MPQRVWSSVFRFALGNDQSGSTHGCLEYTYDIVVQAKAAAGSWEHEVVLSFGAGKFPLAQCVKHHRSKRHGTVASSGLGLADHTVPVGALAHMQLAALKVDIGPAQATQL